MSLNHLSAACLVLATALTGGCADSNPARDLAIAAGVTGGEPKPAPDFVSRSRRTETDYMPVGVSAPKRPLKIKTEAEVSKAESDLDGTRTRVEGRGADLRRTQSQ